MAFFSGNRRPLPAALFSRVFPPPPTAARAARNGFMKSNSTGTGSWQGEMATGCAFTPGMAITGPTDTR